MIDALREILAGEPRIAFALVFGSRARGDTHAGSDLDVAVGVPPGVRLTAAEIGALVSRLEAVAACPVDLAIVSESSIPLRHAIFRDGTTILERDHAELVRQKAQAIVDWLDFKPVHDIMVEGALRAARG